MQRNKSQSFANVAQMNKIKVIEKTDTKAKKSLDDDYFIDDKKLA